MRRFLVLISLLTINTFAAEEVLNGEEMRKLVSTYMSQDRYEGSTASGDNCAIVKNLMNGYPFGDLFQLVIEDSASPHFWVGVGERLETKGIKVQKLSNGLKFRDTKTFGKKVVKEEFELLKLDGMLLAKFSEVTTTELGAEVYEARDCAVEL